MSNGIIEPSTWRIPFGILNAMSSFGERVKTARKNAGLKQEALAEMVGVVQAQISRIERDERGGESMHAEDLVKLATALRVRPQWLLDGGGQREEAAPGAIADISAERLILMLRRRPRLEATIERNPGRWRLSTLIRAVERAYETNLLDDDPKGGWDVLLDQMQAGGDAIIGGAPELLARSKRPAGMPSRVRKK